MNLYDRIGEDIKAAMLAKDVVKRDALRGAKKEFIEAKTAKGGEAELCDEQAIKILQKMIKQRREAAKIYSEQAREDLAQPELDQILVLEAYLPSQLSEAEIESELKKIIEQSGMNTPKDMGKLMGLATKDLGSRAPSSQISAILKTLLN